MKALEVSIDGRVIGLFGSPEQGPFLAMVGNIPRRYMRAHIMTETATESWQWQLPNVQEGEGIAFRITEAEQRDIRPPQFVNRRETKEIANTEHRGAREGGNQVSQTTAKPKVSMKALEVSIDGVIAGVFVPPSGAPFIASLRNGPQGSIVANVADPDASESSEWCLPMVPEGQCISFRMIDSPVAEKPVSQIIQRKMA